MNSEWKEIIAEAMEREAEEIMEEVNSDPAMKDVKAPEGMREELMQMIHECEKQKVYAQLSEEDREYLQIGKSYMKRRRLNRYIVLVAAVVFVLAFGTVSIGENKSLFDLVSRIFSGGEQEIVDSDEVEPILYLHEDEVYEKIEEEYDFVPVKFGYLPENTVFYEATFSEGIQCINMVYETDEGTSLIYLIRPNFREASFGTVVEDEKVQEYQMTVNEIEVKMTEYIVAETGDNQWSIHFDYEDITYMIRTTKMEQEEAEKIVINLKIPYTN